MKKTDSGDKANTILLKCFASLVLFACIGTAISTWLKVDPGFIAPLVTVLIIVCGASIVALSIGDPKPVIGVLIICGGAEVVGLFTGFPFGHYEYTDRWWPTVALGDFHRFPLLLPFAWLLVLGGAYRLARQKFGRWYAVPGCALIATVIDIPMEQAMTNLFEYWKWKEIGPLFGAPIQNSVGWFLVSMIAGSVLAWKDKSTSSLLSIDVLSIFCMFVAFSGFVNGFSWAWVMLAALGLAIEALKRRVNES